MISNPGEAPPPPSACDLSSSQVTGIVGMGLDPGPKRVAPSASLSDPEVINVANLPPGNYLWRVTAFTSPDTTHYSITTDRCVTPTLDVAAARDRAS